MSASSWKSRWNESTATVYECDAAGGRQLGIQQARPWPVHVSERVYESGRLGRLQAPGVDGVCPLVSWAPERSWLAYRAPEAVSVAELLAFVGDMGCAAGVRAGVELLQRAARVLVEADQSDVGRKGHGHGALSSHRLLLDVHGRPHLLGFRLAAEGLLASDTTDLRHAPPERVCGEPEDLGSDLFVLALLAVELMVGLPVYAGSDAQVRAQASRGSAASSVAAWDDVLPDGLGAVLSHLLQASPLDRPEAAASVVGRLDAILESAKVTGPSLQRLCAMAIDARRIQNISAAATVLHLDPARTVQPEVQTVAMRRTPAGLEDPTRTVAHLRRRRPTPLKRRFDLFDSRHRRLHPVALSRDLTVAEAVVELSKTVLRPSFSALGVLEGWYALQVDGRRLDWSTRLGELDGAVVQLEAVFLAAESVDVHLCIPSAGGSATVRTRLSSALPLRWALSAVLETVGLSWEAATEPSQGAVWVNGLLLDGLAPLAAAGAQTVRVDLHPALQLVRRASA